MKDWLRDWLLRRLDAVPRSVFHREQRRLSTRADLLRDDTDFLLSFFAGVECPDHYRQWNGLLDRKKIRRELGMEELHG